MCATDTDTTQQTLLDRIGGPVALDLTVNLFYDKIVADASLAPFFADVNMDQLRSHQRRFFTLALTKVPEDVDVPKLMLEKHQKLFFMGLNETHFDKVAQHLVLTLEALQVRKALIDEVVAIVGPLRAVFEEGSKKFAERSEKKAYIYDRIGGDAAIEAAVDNFYLRCLGDAELMPFFATTDMDRLKHHQRRFFKLAFTEIPEDIDVANLMLTKHQKLFEMGLTEHHFDLVAGHLVATLQYLGVEEPLIAECVAVVAPLRPIFEKGAAIEAAKA
jgi:hemoglobin